MFSTSCSTVDKYHRSLRRLGIISTIIEGYLQYDEGISSVRFEGYLQYVGGISSSVFNTVEGHHNYCRGIHAFFYKEPFTTNLHVKGRKTLGTFTTKGQITKELYNFAYIHLV